MSRPTVLYYSLPGNKKSNKTRSLLVRLGVRLINVSSEDADKTLEELIGQQEIKELDFGAEPDQSVHDQNQEELLSELPSSIEEEIMVFFNFTESAFDRVLRELKKSHLSVNLKAMVTKTNVSWPFIKLYGEIRRERDYIKENS